jgi:hypothetical protein
MNEYFDEKPSRRRFETVPERWYPSTKTRFTTFQKMVVVKHSINRISLEIAHKIFITLPNMKLDSNLLSWSPAF